MLRMMLVKDAVWSSQRPLTRVMGGDILMLARCKGTIVRSCSWKLRVSSFEESVSRYPCRKGGVMETFMSDFIVVSLL
jgi:hypothetical protein